MRVRVCSRVANTGEFSKLDEPKMQSSATAKEEMVSLLNYVAGGALYYSIRTVQLPPHPGAARLPLPIHREPITLHYPQVPPCPQ